MRISATVLGTPDPPGLGAFYADLLGWNVVHNEPDWVMVDPAGHLFCLFPAEV